MQRFKYQAKNARGEIAHGTVQADSESHAYQQLTSQGFYPMSISEEKASESVSKKSPLVKSNFLKSKNVSVRELAGFFDHFAILLNSGFPVLKSLEMVGRQTKNPVLYNAIDQIAKDIQVGSKLSESMANFPTIFPPTVPGAVQAGEASGKLDFIFSELAKTFEAQAELRSKISAALVYPVFVSIFGLLTVFFVMTFIVPKLMIFFETWEAPLPLPTRILMGISTLFTHGFGFVLFGILIGLYVAWRRLSREKKIRLLASATQSIPFARSIFFLADFVPLSRTWALLLKSGVPLLEAIRVSESVVASPVIRKSLKEIASRITQGARLGEAMIDSNIFPELALSFLSVGEESGSLDQAFDRVAQFYEREMDQKLKVLTTLLEPILILLVGLGICFIVLSLLLPIFEINMIAQ